MRLKRSRLKEYAHRARLTRKDSEGSTYTEYASAVTFTGEIWPAGGKIQAQVYGEKLPYIRNVRVDGRYEILTDAAGRLSYQVEDGPVIREGDGLCLYVDPASGPDYRVISIRPDRFLRMEAEKL